MEDFDYQLLEQQLTAAGSPLGAAEAQGLLCGLAAVSPEERQRLWLDEVLEDCPPADLLVQECRGALESLYRVTSAALDDLGLEVRPLLPDDERPLEERSRALAQWCQGLLYGLGLAGVQEAALSPESREALADLGQLSALDAAGLEASDSEEEALAELQEFAWVAFMLIYHDQAREAV